VKHFDKPSDMATTDHKKKIVDMKVMTFSVELTYSMHKCAYLIEYISSDVLMGNATLTKQG